MTVDNDGFTNHMVQAGREGLCSAQAMVFNILALMWLQTVLNYQYRHSISAKAAIKELYKEGGIPRFYHGLPVALIQGPLSRGVSAAANFATLALMLQYPSTANLPTVVVTAVSSLGVALFRLLHYPLDTLKTMSQVEGEDAIAALRNKIRHHGYRALWHGASFGVLCNVVHHTVWFSCFNHLRAIVVPLGLSTLHVGFANLLIGALAAVVTDVVSNPLSVVQVYKQSHTKATSYRQIVSTLVAENGYSSLFTSGLSTRIWIDLLSSAVFTALWRWLADL
eukprot:m.115492 g.115492  ORF g.115492 m.115492 type:complete len:280 (-) comp15495_c0_seq2:2105-2944(-)